MGALGKVLASRRASKQLVFPPSTGRVNMRGLILLLPVLLVLFLAGNARTEEESSLVGEAEVQSNLLPAGEKVAVREAREAGKNEGNEKKKLKKKKSKKDKLNGDGKNNKNTERINKRRQSRKLKKGKKNNDPKDEKEKNKNKKKKKKK